MGMKDGLLPAAVVVYLLAGFAWRAPAWWSAARWLATVVGLRVQVDLEEAHLLRLHGATYRDYAARTGRFLPLVGRLDRGSAPGADPHTHAGAPS
jgi:protein-S-isoprenylcysteine O-methyltransferase Ste14